MDSPFTTKAVLLAILADTGPSCAPAIMEYASMRVGLKLHEGSVYPALMVLENEGLIRRKLIRTRTRAFYYDLTARGRRLVVAYREMSSALFLGAGRGDDQERHNKDEVKDEVA